MAASVVPAAFKGVGEGKAYEKARTIPWRFSITATRREIL
jgi:hypothetical protein